MCAYDFILFPRQDELNETYRFMLGLSAINLGPGKMLFTNLFILLFSFGACQAHTCSFGVGEGTPGNDAVIYLFLIDWEKCILHSYPGLVGRHVGEEITSDNIANCQNVGGRGLQVLVDLDAFAIVGHLSRIQVQGCNIGLSAQCEEQFIGFKGQSGFVLACYDDLLCAPALSPYEACVGNNGDAFRAQYLADGG